MAMYHPHGSQTKMSDYLHDLDLDTFTLTYYPPFEVQLVLVGDDRRRVKENFSGLADVIGVKGILASEVFQDLLSRMTSDCSTRVMNLKMTPNNSVMSSV